jgi:MFS family permease
VNQSALGNPNFLLHLLGSNVSLLGTWIQRLALGWLTWELSHSELWVGAVSFLLFFPIVLVGPIAGVFSDRLEPRKSAIVCNSLLAGLSIVLFALVWTDSINMRAVCLMSILIGIVSSCYQPIRLKLIPALVSKEQLGNAIAWNSISFNIARFIGPAVAGIVIVHWGIGAAFALNTALTGPFIAVLFRIKTRPKEADDNPDIPGSKNLRAEFVGGIQYIRSQTTIARLLCLSAISCVFGRALFELLPVYADLIFKGGSGMLAILTSAGGLGAILAGGMLSRYQRNATLMTHTKAATVITGIMTCAVIAPAPLWLSVTCIATVSFFNTITGVGIQSLIQQDIDDNYRGRVMSIWSAVSFGGVAVGGVAMGAAAEQFGIISTTAAWGSLCIALSVLLFLRGRNTPAKELSPD